MLGKQGETCETQNAYGQKDKNGENRGKKRQAAIFMTAKVKTMRQKSESEMSYVVPLLYHC